MCGLAGFLFSQRINSLVSTLKEMTDAISHRGPDDEGFWFNRTSGSSPQVGLGHRRLSIIDLSTGHQPIGNEDGSVQIVFNGEIYNFQRLRDELIQRGHRFVTTSDTETIVHAYEEFGDDCVTHLRGMFAFAIWDDRRKRLLLARDPFGKKPLFIHEQDGNLVFASEIKALLKFPGIEARLDEDALWDYHTFRYVPGPKTLFRGIRKLNPGSYAVWEKGSLRETRYFVPPDSHRFSANSLPADPVGEFLEQLDEAVKIRMISDVPFGAFLSGGLDSSAIVALMSRHSILPVNTFSVGFSEAKYSELQYAKVIADHFKTDHHELIISADQMIEQLPKLVRYRDAPVSETADIPIYLLSLEARKSVKMVLTGEGSDEILGGYNKHVFENFAGTYHLIPKALRHSVIESFMRRLPYRFRSLKTAVATLGLDSFNERMPRWFGALSSAELSELSTLRPALHATNDGPPFYGDPSNSSLRKILYFDQTSWLPDNLLERGDRMTMAASLEARMPFMDHVLAGFVSNLPDHYRVRNRRGKWILREAMSRILPKAILDRPKVGFSMPVNEWFRGPMREYVYDHLTGPSSKIRPYYRPASLQRTLDEHMQGRQNHEKLIWCLLNLELWHQAYL
jgi:asparagine synthase (glutamine-hydrolysing)